MFSGEFLEGKVNNQNVHVNL